ncbi:MAG: hypothetical protein ACLQME_11490 [Alphaproteobacteria bacterium]
MSLISGFLFFLVSLGLHALAGRLGLIANSVLRFLAVGSTVGLLLILWLIARYGPLSAELITGVLAYAFLCNLYIFLFTFTLSSVSANLLSRLSRQPLGPDEVARLYSGRNMTEARISRLIQAGFLSAGPEGLALTAAGGRIVAVYERLRRLFKHGNDI